MLRELAKKAEEIWDSHVIIYSMVLTPRQSSSYPKTHLQGHLALCASGSAACINALTFVKAVRAEALVLNRGWGSIAGRLTHELCCYHLQRALPQSPAGLGGCKALLEVLALSRKVSHLQCHL